MSMSIQTDVFIVAKTRGGKGKPNILDSNWASMWPSRKSKPWKIPFMADPNRQTIRRLYAPEINTKFSSCSDCEDDLHVSKSTNNIPNNKCTVTTSCQWFCFHFCSTIVVHYSAVLSHLCLYQKIAASAIWILDLDIFQFWWYFD